MSEINRVYGEYSQIAQNVTGDLFENLYYSLSKSITLDDMGVPSGFDIKRFGNIVLAGVGIAGLILNFTPVGMAITTILSILNNLFTPSKEERKRKAIKNIYDHIREKTLDEKKIKLKDNTDKLMKGMSDNTKQIIRLYDDLISGLGWVKDKSDALIREYNESVVYLNKLYAWRIIQYIEKKNDELNYEEINKDIIEVDRKNPEIIRIITNSKHDVSLDLNKVIAEKVIIDVKEAGL